MDASTTNEYCPYSSLTAIGNSMLNKTGQLSRTEFAPAGCYINGLMWVSEKITEFCNNAIVAEFTYTSITFNNSYWIHVFWFISPVPSILTLQHLASRDNMTDLYNKQAWLHDRKSCAFIMVFLLSPFSGTFRLPCLHCHGGTEGWYTL